MSFQYTLNVVDTTGLDSSYVPLVWREMDAALQTWGNYVAGLGSVDVTVNIAPIDGKYGTLATGGFRWSQYFTMDGSSRVNLAGPAYELRTGIDGNGVSPDV